MIESCIREKMEPSEMAYSEMAQLLIIDDDQMICRTMARFFEEAGYGVDQAQTLEEGLAKVEKGAFDVVFLDVRLPDGDGLRQLPAIHHATSSPEVIILTAYADPDSAELAIKNNAWDYIKKPASSESLFQTLTRALQYRRQKEISRPQPEAIHHDIIGRSPKIQACLDLLARAAHSQTNILINGETGTGKELFARAIHANSDRADGNFVVVDCGSLPETLMESLLFGHTRGAFTGADRAEEGLVKHADGGTLFFDEIGELTLSAQKSLLRVLQERRFHPIGATQEIESDFRLVAATNRNLEEMVRAGQFREDLFFRLRSVAMELPPLRERTGDIPLLAEHYLKKLCDAHDMPLKTFSPDFLQELEAYNWAGNVRELFSALEWVMAHALYETVLFPKHLPPQIRVQVARSAFDAASPQAAESAPPVHERPDAPGFEFPASKPDGIVKWKEFRRSLIEKGEKYYLEDLMTASNGDIKDAATLSGLSLPRVYELLRKHRINPR